MLDATKFRRLMDARVKREETKLAAEQAEAEYREIEAELWDDIDESDFEGTVKLDLGPPHGVVVFQPRETYYGRIINDDDALEYLEERALLDDFTKPSIVKARINEHVNQLLEAGQPMPKGLDFYARRYLTVTQQKRKG